MGIKNKITGEMADIIIERRHDRTFNYTYQDIQKELLEKFDTTVSINSIRLRYLKATQQSVITNTVQPAIRNTIQPETVENPVIAQLKNNGLKAQKITEEEKNALLEELKKF